MFLAAGIGAYGRRDLPPDDACLLQGAALPRGRRRHPPPARRAGHPPDGRPAWRRAAEDAHRVPDRDRGTRRDPALRRLLVEGRSAGVGARDRRRARLDPLPRRARGRAAHRRVLVPALLRGLPGPRRRPRPTPATAKGPMSMLVPVGALAVLSTVGGLLSIPGVWHPFTHWIDESAEALVEPTATQDYLTSAIAVTLGLVGLWYARRRFQEAASSSRARPHGGSSSTSSGSTSCTTRCSTGPRSRSRRRCAPTSRSLSSSARSTRSGPGTLQAAGEVGRVQSGLLARMP